MFRRSYTIWNLKEKWKDSTKAIHMLRPFTHDPISPLLNLIIIQCIYCQNISLLRKYKKGSEILPQNHDHSYSEWDSDP